jgi:hypothetical protein
MRHRDDEWRETRDRWYENDQYAGDRDRGYADEYARHRERRPEEYRRESWFAEGREHRGARDPARYRSDPYSGNWYGQDRPEQYGRGRYAGSGDYGDRYRGGRYSGRSEEGSSGYSRFSQPPFSQQPFGHAPFGHSSSGESNEPRYFGTGTQGYGGGPSFTGGTYGVADERSDSPYFQEGGFNQGYYEDQPYARSAEARPTPRRRPYPLGPKGYQRSDERICEDISERLMEAYHIDSSEVTVRVMGGKAILEGTVPDRRMKHAIEDMACAAPGVQDVENRVRVADEAGRRSEENVGVKSRAGAQSPPAGTQSQGNETSNGRGLRQS